MISAKIVRGIGIVLAVLASVGLVVSSLPLSFLAPTPPPISRSDFPADFEFEIVSTEEARAQGLSGRSDIPSRYGMLFVFDEPGSHGFWMKDMMEPIDIIWLDGEGNVLGIESSVSPDTYPKTFYPPAPVSFVLETRAGESSLLGLEVGSAIPLPQ